MNKKNGILILDLLLVVSDGLMIILSFLLAYILRFHWKIVEVTKGIPSIKPYIYLSIFAVLLWLIIFKLSGLYEKRTTSGVDDFYSIFTSVSVGTFGLMAVTFLYRDFSFSRLVVGLAWIISIVFVNISRTANKLLQEHLRSKGIGIKNTLIAGSGTLGRTLLHKIAAHPSLGYRVVGFVDENPDKLGKLIEEKKVLGTIEDISDIIKKYQVDEIIFTLPSSSHHKILNIVADCEKNNVKFKIAPDIFELIASKVGIEEIDGFPLIRIKEVPLSGWNLVIKRGIDIVLSLGLLVLFSPIIIIIAIFIKLDVPGSVFFRQERVGLDGKIFKIFKFRSMVENAEQETGPVFATNDDPRRTKVGIILRKLSFDEIPQLINVFIGNMSMVGPRPERPYFVNQFKNTIPRYFERHKVKSGITGWAQVNGLRGNTSIEERTKYDMYYIENWSILLDIKILVRTAIEFFFHKHAY